MKRNNSMNITRMQDKSAASSSDQPGIKSRIWVLILGCILCLVGVIATAGMVGARLRIGSLELSDIITYICVLCLFVGTGTSLIILELRSPTHGNRLIQYILIVLGFIMLCVYLFLILMTFILMGGLMPGGVPNGI